MSEKFTIDYILENNISKKYYGFIYITTNKINNKKYIGQKKFIKGWEYYLGSGIILKNSIKKYGRENFHRKIISFAYSDVELDELEIIFIKKCNATKSNDYYNIAKGGDGGNTMAGYTKEEKNKWIKKQSISSQGTNALLNEGEVKEIKKEILNYIDMHDIAFKYNVRYTTIIKIKACKNWAWVSSELNDKLLKMNENKEKIINDKIIKYYDENSNLSGFQIAKDLNVGYERVMKLLGVKIKKYRMTLGIVGVKKRSDYNCYVSSIQIDNKQTYLGHYKNYDDAVKARLIGEVVYLKKNASQKDRLEEYDLRYDNINEEFLKRFIKKYSTKKQKKVICITTRIVFSSIREAGIFYNISSFSKNAYLCLNGKRLYCGKHPETGEKLKWMYYEDYINTYGEDKAKELTLVTH